MGESPQTSANQLQDIDPLPCPHCGYDLRANAAENCSECGHIIDRATLGVTSFPWAHRRHAGRIRSYWKTVWLITINSRRLRFENLKSQNLDDGRSFKRVTTFIVALTLSASCAALLTADRALFAATVPPAKTATWRHDLVLPWLAGNNLRPVVPAMLLLFGIHLTQIHHRLFRLKSSPAPLQDRAQAIACYATAPLAALLPLALFCAAMMALMISGAVADNRIFMWLAAVPAVLGFLLLPLTLLRILQWILRVRNLGSEYSLLIGPQLIGLWLFVFLLDLGILPWCIGLIYLAVDSFR